jgi:hypothetical protein
MGRIAPKHEKPKRLLSEHTGLSWGGKMYGRGDEDKLPADFPMDGPHWSDWDGKFDADSIYTKIPHIEQPKSTQINLQGASGARTKKERARDDDPSYSREDEDDDELDEDEVENDAETKRPGYDSYDTASGEHETEDEDDVQPEIEPETPVKKPAAKKSAAAKKRKR